MKETKGYFENLLKNSKPKKQIAVYFDDNTVEKIDTVSKIFSEISDSKSFSRNSLIEEAVTKYLDEAENYLNNEGVDIQAEIEKVRAEKFDTVIFSSNGRGFEDVFMGEKESPCWYPCRVSNEREKKLEYIAIYRGAPVSAITHYAKIKKFVYDEKRNCKVCYFDGQPIELSNKIELGKKGSCFFIGTKYTTFTNLLNATQADDIVFG